MLSALGPQVIPGARTYTKVDALRAHVATHATSSKTAEQQSPTSSRKMILRHGL